MGKKRTARRNPEVTVEDLMFVGPGDKVSHRGTDLWIEYRNGRKIKAKSEQGVVYKMVVMNDWVDVEMTCRIER